MSVDAAPAAWALGTPTERMPARVTRAIEAQRERSEILTSWMQAGVLVVFATLYTLAPSTSPVGILMRPVPWALAFYAFFTVGRLFLAYRGGLSAFMRVLSVIVDMALLTVTIWSFHIEYSQPAAFYLKAPTFTYFFIFVALRALSFSPGYVLLAGGTAAVGWLALLGYALMEPGGMVRVTHNYVEYMTSASILIGGEIDKIISLLLVSVLLAMAVARTRQLLERAVAEQAATIQLARFFSPEVAETLINADELLKPGEGESREAAAMFIDLRGFTKLAATMEPRSLIALLGEYQHIAVLGDPVNRAAKFQNHTKAEGVRALTSSAMRDKARSQGYEAGNKPEKPACEVAGITGPVDLVVIG